MCRRVRCSPSSRPCRRGPRQSRSAAALVGAASRGARARGAGRRARAGGGDVRANARRRDAQSSIAMSVSRLRRDAAGRLRPRAAHARLQRAGARTDPARRAARNFHRGQQLPQSSGAPRAARGVCGANRRPCPPRCRGTVREAQPRRAMGGARARAPAGLLERWLELESRRAPFHVEHIEAAARPPFTAGSRTSCASIASIVSRTARAS